MQYLHIHSYSWPHSFSTDPAPLQMFFHPGSLDNDIKLLTYINMNGIWHTYFYVFVTCPYWRMFGSLQMADFVMLCIFTLCKVLFEAFWQLYLYSIYISYILSSVSRVCHLKAVVHVSWVQSGLILCKHCERWFVREYICETCVLLIENKPHSK